MKRHIEYFKYVCRHKWFVFLACIEWQVPLWRAIVHDWTKFTPGEWLPYARSFYNPDGSRRDTKTDSGTIDMSKTAFDFAVAWNSHQKSNKHHWQYWVLINDEDGISPLEIPETYVREMLADWEGAGLAITGKADAQGWYIRQQKKFIFHPDTRKLIESFLGLEA